MSKQHPRQNPNKNQSFSDYAKYSGIATKMILIMLVGVWAGFKLDQYLVTKPIFTVIFAVTFVFLALYSVIRDVTKS